MKISINISCCFVLLLNWVNRVSQFPRQWLAEITGRQTERRTETGRREWRVSLAQWMSESVLLPWPHKKARFLSKAGFNGTSVACVRVCVCVWASEKVMRVVDSMTTETDLHARATEFSLTCPSPATTHPAPRRPVLLPQLVSVCAWARLMFVDPLVNEVLLLQTFKGYLQFYV